MTDAERREARRLRDHARYWADPGRHRARVREYMRQRRAREQALLTERQRLYRSKDPERYRNYGRRYNERLDPAEKTRRSRAYRERMTPEQRAHERARYNAWWAGRDRNLAKPKSARRRARLAAVVGSYTAQEWLALVAFWSNTCAYCGMSGPLEADHRIPLCRGGTNYISNILPACRSCNRSKGAKTEDEYRTMRLVAARRAA